MEIINFIFRLGVVFAIFGFIWGIIQIMYTIVRATAVKSIGEDYLVKMVKYFFLVDVTFIFAYNKELNINQLITTALILMMYFIGKLQNQQNKISMIQMAMNQLPKKEIKFDLKAEIIVISMSVGFFIWFIFYPQFSQNPVSIWFHDSIIDIENTPIFGFFFKVIGFIFIFNMFTKMMNGISQIVSGKPMFGRKPPFNNDQQNETKDDSKFDDFEELD